MKKKIVLASGNENKLREFREILSDFEIISCKALGFTKDIEETGKSFYENALIKAKTVATELGISAIADDSGLCVDALDGAPGIYSARYAGDGIDIHNNRLLLKNLEGIKDRKAKFVSVIVCYRPDGSTEFSEGISEGEILYKPEGKNGFGYDPIFYSYDLKKSFGTASVEEKNRVSHRSRALMKIRDKL